MNLTFNRTIEMLPERVLQKSDCTASIKGSETILLVEDDDALRGLMLSVLGEAGYTVIEATNGIEGLQIALREAGRIDLVLTDVIMPCMEGTGMAENITTTYPDTKILYMSGHSEVAGGHAEILRQGRTLLEKPFEMPILLRHVREVLELDSPLA